MGSSADIITLDNFEHKMPRWDPTSPSHLYALVDMGSNGIRFSISDLSPPRTRLLKCVYRERAAISLFDALNSQSDTQGGLPLTFPVEIITLVSQTLARYRSIAIDDYGVPSSQVAVFATEAMRRAQNAVAMLEAIRAEAPDLVVHILAPEVETLFGAVGARSGFVDVRGLLLDLGGGSVQMTYMDSYSAHARSRDEPTVGYEIAAALAGQSLPFGAARLIRVLEDADAVVQAAEISKLQSGMSNAFEKLRAKFPSLAETVAASREDEQYRGGRREAGIDIYLCGGGFRGYGSILQHSDSIQPYPIPAIGSYTVSGKAFVKTKEMMRLNMNFDGKIFGMSKRRRAQFPAIVTVVDALIAAVPRIRSVTFCAGGNREGALVMKLPREIRESNPLTCIEASVPPPPIFASVPKAAGPPVILDTLWSSLPEEFDLPSATTIFGLGLGILYTSQIWARSGEDADANASAALHDAVTRNSGCPGLTHLARAVLGLTLCARWGSNLGPIDEQLHDGLRALVDRADPDASFWTEYIGAVTAAFAMVVKTWPRTNETVVDNVKFRCVLGNGKRLKVFLHVSLSEKAAKGIVAQDLIDVFKDVNKLRDDRKVVVSLSRLP
ncbi:Ppx/GppA phosphatase family-domain-containing protein [Lasiosphaeris hirsuta]|uniref:Ppx/GppA phosphatase family-domain-containing protein n=1 Tax=Lasiosphaeris hirsuta TaxID=260670 RepID=A0AA40BCG1_9PEZI|nr:Ppx/GppA phosphatase family-domain-containing protein [Lasiosphaeris hirsuta]